MADKNTQHNRSRIPYNFKGIHVYKTIDLYIYIYIYGLDFLR